MEQGRLFLHLTLAWGVLSLLLLIIAWRKAVRRDIADHKMLMIMLTFGSWIFFVSYLLHYIIPGFNLPEVPNKLIPWFAIHGTVALIPLFGAAALIYTRLKGSKDAFLNRHHKLLGSITAAIWFFTHLGGFVNFWLLI